MGQGEAETVQKRGLIPGPRRTGQVENRRGQSWKMSPKKNQRWKDRRDAPTIWRGMKTTNKSRVWHVVRTATMLMGGDICNVNPKRVSSALSL